MARHLVCLTFDFDTCSGLIARGMTTPSPISRGEFGVIGARRLLDLLKKYNIQATWFVPGFTIETFPDIVRRVFEAGHEIGHHGWTHMPPASWSRVEEENDLQRGNETIRKLTGRYPRGYRSPSWDLSQHTVELLLQNSFVYDSSLMGHDYLPYRARHGDVVELQQPLQFGAETRLIEIPVSWSLDDFPHFEFLRTATHLQPGLLATEGVLQNWKDDFDYMTQVTDWGAITYTCHPYVIGRGHRIMMLERLLNHLVDRGAAFCTMETAADEFLKRGTPAKS
jgi:peptidoglycan/xylan/chitin deacetylase (PgdA/CDA1 family)